MMPPNGELSGSTAGCRACSARLLANALERFVRPRESARGRTIGRVRKHNSPYGRAQRDRTIIHGAILNRLFVIVWLDRTIQCFKDSPIKSGNDCMALTYGAMYNIPTWFFSMMGAIILFFHKNANKQVYKYRAP